MPIVTAYDTLGQEGLTVSLAATKAKTIFLDAHLLKNLVNPLKVATEIQFVVYNTDSYNEVKQSNIDSLKAAHEYLTILSFEELRQLGESNLVDAVPPSTQIIRVATFCVKSWRRYRDGLFIYA
jgi:long-chain acyl-CoA synthetase